MVDFTMLMTIGFGPLSELVLSFVNNRAVILIMVRHIELSRWSLGKAVLSLDG
jgi:hypothetical protein